MGSYSREVVSANLPLNPDGELLLGVKIESQAAIPHIEEILAVPGIGYAEMGPGDMSRSLGYRSLVFDYDPEGAEALLDEAGYPRGPDGTRFKVEFMHLNRYSTSWPELVGSYWKKDWR